MEGAKKLIILHVAPLLFAKPNGIINAVLPLVFHESEHSNVRSAIWGLAKDKAGDLKYDLEYFPFSQYPKLADMPEPYNKPNLVVFHTVYEFEFIRIAKDLKKKGIKYIVVPHCSLTEEAQKVKSVKKKLGNFFFFKSFLKDSLAIRYTSQGEKKTSKYIEKQNFVVENGVDIPVNHAIETIKNVVNMKCINITFIGRIDINQKGLDAMLRALALIKNELIMKNVIISLYGNDQNGSKEILTKKIRELDLNKNVFLYEPIFGEEKEKVLLNTTAFIHTSRFEGQPIVVLEVLARGIPCILTEGTNFAEDIEEYDAGWWCEFDDGEIARTILKAINDINVKSKGKNAQRLIVEKYQWKQIAEKTLRNYKNLLN